ncbi:MAG: hypothetical protein KatS3mg003_0199 [Candidatus Nitrosocaldaceae archaeon]|nr:MAG: hypothetical protein KatS3mg003_0199 [Candidatus Nitrosocaldaceae archaeon]
MAEEPRSAIYAIRWEILVMAVSLILIAVVVYTIPNDFSDRLLKERAAEEAEELANVNATNATSNIEEIIQP